MGVATGVLERVGPAWWRLTLFDEKGRAGDVFEGPLSLLLDVIEDLSIELAGVRLLPHDSED
jgi:hypothetical protein